MTDATDQHGPLHGKVVLDLTLALAGPYATLLLRGLGARVIKVESPVDGDLARNNSPYVTAAGLSPRRETADDMSVSILIRGRGKESIGLDLKSPAGREVLFELVGHADVLVENFSTGVTARLGVDYETVRRTNPRLVYTSISGFGSGGDPDRKAMDTTIQGLSGVMMTAGMDGDPPVRLGIPIADLTAPLFGVIGTLAALNEAERTGIGQHVDVSMLGALTSVLACEGIDALDTMGLPTRTGRYMSRLAPFGTFEARDGWFTICAPTDRFASGVFRAMGRADLITAPEFENRDARVSNSGRLHALVAGWAAEQTAEEALTALKRHGVPAELVRTPYDALRDPDLLERGEVVPLEHPTLGTVSGVSAPGVPIRFSKTPVAKLEPSATLGQHTAEVLAGVLGYPDGRILELQERGVVSATRSSSVRTPP
jgi:CoA:oxalate CoA-transferase